MWQRVQVLKPLLRQASRPDVIVDLAYDKPIGTKFIAHHSDRLESRKQWLFAAPSAGYADD